MNFHKYDFEFIYPGFYFVKFDINLNFTNVIVVIHYIDITIFWHGIRQKWSPYKNRNEHV